MARQDDIRDLVFKQAAEPIPLQSIAFTTSAAFFALAPSDAEGYPVASPAGQVREGVDLLLQSTQQCYVRFQDNSTTGVQVTATTGIQLQPGVPVQICIKASRQVVSVLGVVAGTLNIFVVR